MTTLQHDNAARRPADLPWWLSTGTVLLLVVAYWTIAVVHQGAYEVITRKEGVAEWGTVVVLLAGIVAGLAGLRSLRRLPATWLRVWLVLNLIGLIYFAGEEISWGQHLFGWGTPELFKELNVQDETNFHNMSRWLGRQPRNLIELWTVVGGIIVPLWLRMRLGPRSAAYWFWPTTACTAAAVMAQAVYLPSRIGELGDFETPAPLGCSEVQEFFIAAVLALYVGSFVYRAGQVPEER